MSRGPLASQNLRFQLGGLIILALIRQPCQLAWGHPPGPIDLQYDPQTKVLHAELRHVTDNQRQHHIRRLYVYKNDAPTQKFSYVKQTTATRLIQDVPLDASSGDTIRVKAVCSEAGYKEETLVIP
jgi:hypothetical protein